MPGAELGEISVSNTFLVQLVDGLKAAVGWAAREHDCFCMHLLRLANVMQQLLSSLFEHIPC